MSEQTDATNDAIFEQWRRDRKDRERERRAAQGPGLHKVGPNPWDYEYNPAVGQKVTFMNVDGRSMTGTISDFTEDEETGELRMTMQEFPDAMQFPAGLDG